MTKFIELYAIDLRREDEVLSQNGTPIYEVVAAAEQAREAEDRFDELIYDDLERPVPIAVPISVVSIAVDHIREFYPRKKAMTGTRIVFQNGSATIVKESYDEVKTALLRFGN